MPKIAVPWPLVDIVLALPAYVLVLVRITGLMLTAPVYSSRVIPARVRVALAMVVAAMVFPLVGGQAPREITLAAALVGVAGELMIGATIGLALSILLAGGEVAGLVVGRQASIALAEVFDPAREEHTSIVGQVYMVTLTTLFLLVGGHRATMAALLDTYDAIPLLSFQLNQSIVLLLVEMLAASFILGIRLAGPVLLALFLLGVAMAFLSRTMPQFNVLSVGFTVRVLVGLAVAAIAIAASEQLLLDAVWDGMQIVRTSLGLDPAQSRLVS